MSLSTKNKLGKQDRSPDSRAVSRSLSRKPARPPSRSPQAPVAFPPNRPCVSYPTQEHALTVAGQWRILTAFPSIPLHWLIAIANLRAGRFPRHLRGRSGGGAGFPVINRPVVQVKEGVRVRFWKWSAPGWVWHHPIPQSGPHMRRVQKFGDQLERAEIYSQHTIPSVALFQGFRWILVPPPTGSGPEC